MQGLSLGDLVQGPPELGSELSAPARGYELGQAVKAKYMTGIKRLTNCLAPSASITAINISQGMTCPELIFVNQLTTRIASKQLT